MRTIQPQAYFKSVRQFKCSNCAGELNIINKRTQFIGCQYCGAVSDASSEAHQVITRLNAPSKFLPKSFIKLGMNAVFNEKKHQVIGRTCWQSDYKEYWSEEGDSGYSDEKWEYDEWVLMSENYTYFYLIEDKDDYFISKPFLPQYPNLPRNTQISNFTSNKPERVVEYGDSTVTYFEGESTYQIKAGDQVKFTQYNAGKSGFISEWRLAEDGKEIKEIEFFREEPISRSHLLTAFEDNDSIRQAKQVVGQINNRKRFRRITYWLTALVFFVLLVSSGRGSEIFSASYLVPTATLTSATATEDDPLILSTTKPMSLQKTNRVYQIVLSASIPDNAEVWTGLEILNEKGEVINAIEGDFYRASGDEAWQEDGESGVEHWEEVETSNSAYYRLDQPGTYSARIFALPAKAQEAKVNLKIYEETTIGTYYLIGLIIFALMAILNSIPASLAKAASRQ